MKSASGESGTQLFPIFVANRGSKTHWKVGYIDAHGVQKIDPIFDDGTRFHDGLAAIKQKGKWGFIDTLGRLGIEPRFLKPGYFESGVASVQTALAYGVVDACGNFLSHPKLEEIMPFSQGMASFTRQGRARNILYGYIDRGARIVIPAKFHGAGSFSEGLAPVKLDGKWGYINVSGDFQIEPHFQTSRDLTGRELLAAGRFSSEGLAPVPVGGKVGFIDKTGNIHFIVDFDLALPFTEGRAIVRRNGQFGFIDPEGRVVVNPRFTLCHSFSGGWAPVEVTSRGKRMWGFIDRDGEWIIEPKFLNALDITHGLCLVETGESIAYINKVGEFVWEAPFVEHRRFGL